MAKKATKPEPIRTGPKEPSIEESAEALRVLGVDPARFLGLAARAEKRARGKSPGDAIRDDPRAFFAPSVSDALVHAAIANRQPAASSLVERVPELGDGLYLTTVSVTVPKATRALVNAVKAALLSPPQRIVEEERQARLVRDLRRAWRVQLEAERIAARFEARRKPDGKPDGIAVAQARQHVAEGEGRTVEALQKGLGEARDEAPDAGWPEIMPERRRG